MNPLLTFLVCPTPITQTTSPNLCTAVVNYIASAGGALSYNYIFSGMTVGSGSGTGSGSVFNKGITTVVINAVTTCGNPSCTFTVTVNDGQNPSIICPANIVRNTDPNVCSTAVTYTSPTFSDNCPGASLTLTSAANTASGSTFPKGTTMVNWKVTDASNNMAVCDFTITVNDTQNPAISCPANITKVTDLNLCSAVVTYAMPTSSDNCSVGSTVLTSPANTASGLAFNKGATTVSWKATDGSGNMAVCNFTVTVTDGQAPTITCPLNQTKSTDPGGCTAVATYAATATDNCGPLPSLTMQSGIPSGMPFPKGTTTVVMKATDGAGLTKTCSFRVTVNDTQAPTISCPASQSANTTGSTCASAAVTYTLPTATDNCLSPAPAVTRTSGLASGSLFPKGTNTVVWRAMDGAGNTKTCSFTVTVTDNTPPGITCPGNIAVTAAPGQCSTVATYTNPTATDNCGVASVVLTSGLASYSIFPQGVTTNTWRAMDDSGLTNTCTFTVTVSCGTGPSETTQAARETKKSVANLGLHLTPNPASTNVTISLEGFGTSGAELTILDALGRVAWRQTLEAEQTQVTVDLSALGTGAYWVSAKNDGQLITKRLIVQQ